MQRSILFRGKRVDTNEWIYGYFAMFGKIATIMCLKDTYWYAVQPETIGQFISLKDRNGKDVYEDDIVKVEDKVMAVVFQDGCWRTPYMYSKYRLYGWKPGLIEVIGNLHDTPITEEKTL